MEDDEGEDAEAGAGGGGGGVCPLWYELTREAQDRQRRRPNLVHWRFSQWRHEELSRIVDAAVEPNLVSRTNDGWSDLIERYEGINHGEYLKLFADIATLRHESDHLEASVRRQTGEDLPSGATAAELRGLEHKLECALGKVSETKVHILEEQNSFLGHMAVLFRPSMEQKERTLLLQQEGRPNEAMMLTLLERINPDHGTTFTVLRCLCSASTNKSSNMKVKKAEVYL
ncbi:uncharacterized protein [Triticum aestivum]|uniref:uncharacterized protein n=1 Tax=Triticum aestivum TaxID=4565 RepID=UPI001D019E1F|nr:uncharacterized protein LOC123090447 [Triticum aestivum]